MVKNSNFKNSKANSSPNMKALAQEPVEDLKQVIKVRKKLMYARWGVALILAGFAAVSRIFEINIPTILDTVVLVAVIVLVLLPQNKTKVPQSSSNMQERIVYVGSFYIKYPELDKKPYPETWDFLYEKVNLIEKKAENYTGDLDLFYEESYKQLREETIQKFPHINSEK